MKTKNPPRLSFSDHDLQNGLRKLKSPQTNKNKNTTKNKTPQTLLPQQHGNNNDTDFQSMSDDDPYAEPKTPYLTSPDIKRSPNKTKPYNQSQIPTKHITNINTATATTIDTTTVTATGTDTTNTTANTNIKSQNKKTNNNSPYKPKPPQYIDSSDFPTPSQKDNDDQSNDSTHKTNDKPQNTQVLPIKTLNAKNKSKNKPKIHKKQSSKAYFSFPLYTSVAIFCALFFDKTLRLATTLQTTKTTLTTLQKIKHNHHNHFHGKTNSILIAIRYLKSLQFYA